MMDIRCWNPDCNKLFAHTENGNVLVVASTAIEFDVEEATEIQIRCNRCKKLTSLIIK